MNRKLPLLVLLLAPAVLAQDHKPRGDQEMHALHRDNKAYIAMLEDPKRDAYQKPHEVLQALALRPGEQIADIGSGSGYFTLRFAAHLGDKGRDSDFGFGLMNTRAVLDRKR